MRSERKNLEEDMKNYYENGVYKKYKRFRDIPTFQTDHTEEVKKRR